MEVGRILHFLASCYENLPAATPQQENPFLAASHNQTPPSRSKPSFSCKFFLPSCRLRLRCLEIRFLALQVASEFRSALKIFTTSGLRPDRSPLNLQRADDLLSLNCASDPLLLLITFLWIDRLQVSFLQTLALHAYHPLYHSPLQTLAPDFGTHSSLVPLVRSLSLHTTPILPSLRPDFYPKPQTFT